MPSQLLLTIQTPTADEDDSSAPTYVPTASPPTGSPTLSPRPTTSPQPTPAKCDGYNPEKCGCANVNQADYQGTVSKSKTGEECIRWDGTEDSGFTPEDYPDGSLDNNFCRNPNKDDSSGAWCYTSYTSVDNNWYEYCDVPYCFPSSASCSDLNDNISSMSEDLQASCALVQCVIDPGFDSEESHAISRENVKPECSCLFETWDCKYGSKGCTRSTCCANKAKDLNSTAAASCECSIKPDCEAGDAEKCFYFAEHCCQDDDQDCKCEYNNKACRLRLEGDLLEEEFKEVKKTNKYCNTAKSSCCGDGLDIGGRVQV